MPKVKAKPRAKARSTAKPQSRTKPKSTAKPKPKVRVWPIKPAATFDVRALDPMRKCGPGTTVEFLARVIERQHGQLPINHLVYFDRHGWYCEHGPACPAVAHAKRARPRVRHAS